MPEKHTAKKGDGNNQDTCDHTVNGIVYTATRVSGMRADRPATNPFHALFRPYVYRGTQPWVRRGSAA